MCTECSNRNIEQLRLLYSGHNLVFYIYIAHREVSGICAPWWRNSEARNTYELVCCNIIVILIKLCAFISSNCNNWNMMHGMENVKLVHKFAPSFTVISNSFPNRISHNTWKTDTSPLGLNNIVDIGHYALCLDSGCVCLKQKLD